MSYRIIALDIDGTMTNSKKEISRPTREALIDIQKKGCKVVIASGRPTPGITPLAKELELMEYGGFIVAYNGARIISCKTGEILRDRTIPSSVFPELFEIARGTGVQISTYKNDEAIVAGLGTNPYLEFEARFCNMPIEKTENFLDSLTFPVNKFLYSSEPEKLDAPEKLLKERFRGFLNIFRSELFFLEAMPNNVDKAQALLKLLGSLGMSRDEMICCGDSFNDITMIECAGLGVAMANAQEVVKASADYITASNDDDGIVEVVEKFMKP